MTGSHAYDSNIRDGCLHECAGLWRYGCSPSRRAASPRRVTIERVRDLVVQTEAADRYSLVLEINRTGPLV